MKRNNLIVINTKTISSVIVDSMIFTRLISNVLQHILSSLSFGLFLLYLQKNYQRAVSYAEQGSRTAIGQ